MKVNTLRSQFAALVALSAVVVQTGFGAEEYSASAQVYELSMSVKTTQAVRGNLKKSHPFADSVNAVVYRKQGTQRWAGVIWGCECESIMGRWGLVGSSTVSGVAIWDVKKPNTIELLDDMKWHVLNAFDKNGDKVEGAWTIGESTDDSGAFLSFAGFGTLAVKYTRNPCEDPELSCGSYIKSMSGNVAGWMPAPVLTIAGRPGRCTFCGDSDPGEDDTTNAAVAWSYCPCMDLVTTELTAVSGTWNLKYNAAMSKVLMDNPNILDVYKKFPSNVKLAISNKLLEFVK